MLTAGQLANLNQTASGGGGIVRRIGLYGPAHTKLNAAIRRERWKDTVPPIGPLGTRDRRYYTGIIL